MEVKVTADLGTSIADKMSATRDGTISLIFGFPDQGHGEDRVEYSMLVTRAKVSRGRGPGEDLIIELLLKPEMEEIPRHFIT
tara:strand:- start:193 stop:438 length:246 start_codon:yes stop_codon:yes gene_type:complete